MCFILIMAMDKTFNGDAAARNKALRGKPSAEVDGLWSNFRRNNAMTMEPRPGDVVIYKNGSSLTGLVETVNGRHVTTIEGNTSADNSFERNGGIVFRKEFTIGDGSPIANKLTGFGRPDWDSVMGRGSSLNTIWARYIVGKSAAGVSTYGKGYQKSWESEQKSITQTLKANKAAASWNADNEES